MLEKIRICKTYLILAEVVEGDLHWPMALKILTALGSEGPPRKVRAPVSWDLPSEVLELSYSLSWIFRWLHENRIH